VWRDGREQHVRPKSFVILVHLIEQRPIWSQKDELMDVFWKNTALQFVLAWSRRGGDRRE
jgi:DNA-binding winged helix-turn-helix (wHTH) protein